MLSCPEAVKKAFVKHDWRLRLEWHPKQKVWQILRLRQAWTKHLSDAIHPVTGRLHLGYLTIVDIRNSLGDPRSPAWEDYHRLRHGDWQNERPKDVVNRMIASHVKYKDDLEKDADAHREATVGEYGWKVATGAVSRGWEPEGTRSW